MAVLINFHHDYADEFEVYGFAIIAGDVTPEAALAKFLEGIEADWRAEEAEANGAGEDDSNVSPEAFPHDWYFGSNEMIDFNTQADLHESFVATAITEDAADQIVFALDGDARSADSIKQALALYRQQGYFYYGHLPTPTEE